MDRACKRVSDGPLEGLFAGDTLLSRQTAVRGLPVKITENRMRSRSAAPVSFNSLVSVKFPLAGKREK